MDSAARPTMTNQNGFELALNASELPEGRCRAVRVGETLIAFFRLAGRFHATSAICPHAGGPIAEGEIDGTRVICPFHAWRFDVTNGACDHHPAHRLRVYPVEVRDGAVWVKIAEEVEP